MKKTTGALLAIYLMTGLVSGQNLLSNGDFNTVGTGAPAGWASWSFGSGGYASYKDPADSFANDGTPYINAGNWGDWWSGGGGWNQIVPATAGISYQLSAKSGTENWESAAGEMRLIFLDSTATVIRQDVGNTANYEANKPWSDYTVTSLAPEGTTQVKVEFATWGARGTVMWDNASLISLVPEPGSFGFLTAGIALLIGCRSRRNHRRV